MTKNFIDGHTATTFKTREECEEWIARRVMRFKASFVQVPLGGNHYTHVLQKHSGAIVDASQPGYKKYEFDEPLKRLAKPVRDGEVWRAVIPTEQGA